MLRPYRIIAERLTGLSRPALCVLRVVAGWLFILHALFKFQNGLASFETYMLKPAHLPLTSQLSWAIPTLELVAGVLLVVGLLTRVAATLLALEMVGTGFLVKLSVFHSGVLGPKGSGGAELDFLYLAVFLLIIISGPGWAALDGLLGLEPQPRTAGTEANPTTAVPAAADGTSS
ncbi:DoxX family protein [Streptomyces sp. NPDC051320]|uniref:DoxX family protein n=1 Tax=Streptomyces sp. NPDC051320 TaxID=3154644 RepID=UPI00344064FF